MIQGDIDPTELDYVYDATDEWQEHENGKVVQCVCGQDIGVAHDVDVVECASCGKQVVDTEAESRGGDVQTQLGKFT